jgi:3-hydroxyisobutyrate dehydrogenase-like beta-hydroxyacid dehydrogenase
VAAASFAATSEALLVGARFGLRPEDLLAALNASTGAAEVPDADFTAAIRHWEEENATELPLLE